jgi:hypothetical protein
MTLRKMKSFKLKIKKSPKFYGKKVKVKGK